MFDTAIRESLGSTVLVLPSRCTGAHTLAHARQRRRLPVARAQEGKFAPRDGALKGYSRYSRGAVPAAEV